MQGHRIKPGDEDSATLTAKDIIVGSDVEMGELDDDDDHDAKLRNKVSDASREPGWSNRGVPTQLREW